MGWVVGLGLEVGEVAAFVGLQDVVDEVTDEAARDAMLSEIQTYLIDWKNVIQLPLVKELADPRMTTRMLANQEINQYDFPRNNEEDVCI